jgi:hypothetical protein
MKRAYTRDQTLFLALETGPDGAYTWAEADEDHCPIGPAHGPYASMEAAEEAALSELCSPENHRELKKAIARRGAAAAGKPPKSAAERAEARCAAEWRRFLREERRNAVKNVLEAIKALSDDQRGELFQALEETYQAGAERSS